MSAATFSTNASRCGRWTYARVAAVQSWPVLIRAPATAPLAAASRSASSNTTNGALPPSSRCTRLIVPVASSITRWPTGVEPVNETIETSGWLIRASPTLRPGPVSTLITPAGMPAASASSATIREVSGVISAGLRTMVLPAATAGRIFHMAICSG